MRILDKYIIRNFLSPFFYCLALFIFLYIIIDLFGHLDEILKYSVPILILQEYYLSMIPFIIMHTAPIAALVSTIYVISTMNKYDEISAMRASGINLFRILLPFISMGIAISIAIFAISEKLLPAAMKNAQSIKENYIEKDERRATSDERRINNIALYGKNNTLIFIKNYDRRDNTANWITILEQDKDSNVTAKTSARQGQWTGEAWIFSDILIFKLDEKGMVSGNPVFFKEKAFEMENPKELISKGTNYEFMSFKDLSSYIHNFANTSPDIIQRLGVDLHQKISFPFTSLVIILIAAAFAIKIRPRGKMAQVMGLGVSLVIGFIYYVLMATCIALGKGGILPPFLSAHLANIVFGLVGILSIRN